MATGADARGKSYCIIKEASLLGGAVFISEESLCSPSECERHLTSVAVSIQVSDVKGLRDSGGFWSSTPPPPLAYFPVEPPFLSSPSSLSASSPSICVRTFHVDVGSFGAIPAFSRADAVAPVRLCAPGGFRKGAGGGVLLDCGRWKILMSCGNF